MDEDREAGGTLDQGADHEAYHNVFGPIPQRRISSGLSYSSFIQILDGILEQLTLQSTPPSCIPVSGFTLNLTTVRFGALHALPLIASCSILLIFIPSYAILFEFHNDSSLNPKILVKSLITIRSIAGDIKHFIDCTDIMYDSSTEWITTIDGITLAGYDNYKFMFNGCGKNAIERFRSDRLKSFKCTNPFSFTKRNKMKRRHIFELTFSFWLCKYSLRIYSERIMSSVFIFNIFSMIYVVLVWKSKFYQLSL